MTDRKLTILLAIGLSLCLTPVLRAQGNPAQTIKVKVIAEQANLRERPDIGSAILQLIPEGTILEADQKEGEWYLVRYTLEDGGVMAGYIHESLVVETARPQEKDRPREIPRQVRIPEREPPQEAAKPERPPRAPVPLNLRFSLSGGWSRIGADDLNSGALGVAEYYGAVRDVSYDGWIDGLHTVLYLGIEFSFQIAPELYLGVGADILRGANKSVVDFPLPDPVIYTAKPAVRSVPVRVSLTYYLLPFFYVKGGLGFFFTTADHFYRFSAGPMDWQEWKGTTKSQGIGLDGAAGIEWDFYPNVSFFAEAGYRYAEISRMVGEETVTASGAAAVSVQGALFHYLKTAPDGKGYGHLFVHASRPAGEDVSQVREARVDLSGTTIRAGIRIRF